MISGEIKLRKQLNSELKDHEDKTIVNLASNEYFKAIDRECS